MLRELETCPSQNESNGTGSIGGMKKEIPEFKSEVEEFEFWSTADTSEYFDWNKAEKAKFIDLRPTPRPGFVTKLPERA
jgi:hypothetical protein